MTSAAEDHDTLPPSQDPQADRGVQDPPALGWGMISSLGPGLIIAGSIVGSGELIATTKTGAQAGISLLWLIIVGCVIKVFVQIELGRYTLSQGESTLAALDQIPGPKFKVRWIIWYWVVMMLASMGQLGGIVGGVGQALAISLPIRGDFAAVVALPSAKECRRFLEAERLAASGELELLPPAERDRTERFRNSFQQAQERLGEPGEARLRAVAAGESVQDPFTYDDRLWATLTGLCTAFLLYFGRYNTIQNLSTVLVVAFTFVTLGNVVSLQTIPQWAISWSEFWHGLSFSLPEPREGVQPLHTALATFGIIGVGATELIAYPYWCLEKGYARAAGKRSADDAWAVRARGWIRVMTCDAFASMVIYTAATLAFFLMGVAVLSREGRDPEGMRMVTTLSEAYVPVFGEYARWLFLIGAVAVLYSTYLVASAGHVRTWLDAFKLFGWMPKHDEASHQRMLKVLSFIFPLLCLLVFLAGFEPVQLVLLSGILQAVMLPMLAGAALYFRYTQTDVRLRPGRLWDAALISSSLGLLVAGCWGAWTQWQKIFG